ncbi:uncharacterized protein LOC142179831 [Nicotiana tabacum]|uniref:Uncharacterized protein LOC142179831 n=1 Tax=Nicotiana tabacum TaxID=4097 RepID=A0AC58UBF1_TOBAC
MDLLHPGYPLPSNKMNHHENQNYEEAFSSQHSPFPLRSHEDHWGASSDSSKTRKEYNDVDREAIEKNFRAKKILVCGIGPDEYNRIFACQFAKEIWEAIQTAQEGTTQVKQSKINMRTTEYELFRMKDDESIQDMHTRFTSIINELHSLGEIIPRNKLVRKILSVLPGSWESKVNAITKAKDLQTLTIDELIGEVEHERDDLVVVVVDLKETIEVLKREKDVLTERIEKIEHERDDLLVVVVDLKEIIEELKRVKSSGNIQKGKEVAMSSERKQPKMGYILGVGRVGKTPTHSIENVYYVNGLKYSLLSVSKICDEGNKVEFLSKTCTVTNLVTGEVVLLAKRFKNIYVADFESLHNGDLTCLSDVDDDVELWHKRLGHASFSLLIKLVRKDLVRGLPKSRFKDHKIQVNMSHNIVSIRSDHGTEFDNAKFDEFYVENGISHNFSAPEHPQQNGVVERKNRTPEDMERTMLIDSGVAKGF